MKPTFNKIIFLVSVLSLSATICADTVLKVNNPWIKDSPPGIHSNGAYLMIENSSDKPVVIIAAKSDAFGKIIIHKTMLEGQMATMTHQNHVEIPAHGSFEFKPGGYHLMLMHRKHDIKPGDPVTLTLILQDGAEVDLIATVYKNDAHTNLSTDNNDTKLTSVEQHQAQQQHDNDMTFIFFSVGIAINILMIFAFLFWAYKQWNINQNHNKPAHSK